MMISRLFFFSLIFASLASLTLQADESLQKALVFHASFDEGFDADLSKDDPVAYVRKSGDFTPLKALEEVEDVKLVPEAGRFGAALWFPHKSTMRPTYEGETIFGYNTKDWNTTVSLWLRLTPDEDLEPGYCDPIQIVGGDSKKGFIFLEWSKDHSPRYFRYAVRPKIELWDPEGLGWEGVPEARRPMVQLQKAPFSRDQWTHAAFTLEHINREVGKARATLYLNGEKQGSIDNHNLVFDWNPADVRLVLGAAYVGYLDDVAVFNRVLNDEEVSELYQLENGIADLKP